MTNTAIFHKTITVFDLDETRRFYGDLLGCPTARRRNDSRSVDFDFFGNHLVCHLATGAEAEADRTFLSGSDFRHHHFGLVLDRASWDALLARLNAADAPLFEGPIHRFVGEPREEGLVMLRDPSGHIIEFKAFRDIAHLFARGDQG